MLPYERDAATAEDLIRRAIDLLSREIRDYPTPIAGCDAQYTRLIGDRRRLQDALNALRSTPFVPTPRALEPTG